MSNAAAATRVGGTPPVTVPDDQSPELATDAAATQALTLLGGPGVVCEGDFCYLPEAGAAVEHPS